MLRVVFRIWQNALSRYAKWLTNKEVKTLLDKGIIEVEFISKR